MNLDFDLIRSEVRVARKEYSPDDCPVTFTKDLSENVKYLLEELPTIDLSKIEDEDFNEDEFCLFDDIFDGKQQFYILIWKGRKFFIDTQGYTYGRYCGGLID
jgi:hypothetical protein